MSFLFRIFGPSNSILLGYDHITDADLDEISPMIEEVSKVYEFTTLSRLVNPGASRRRKGFAALLLREARKSTLLRMIPKLQDHEVPFTLFLRPECIGTNQLPISDELTLYEKHHPEKFQTENASVLAEKAWKNPDEGEGIRAWCRREMGPLPLNSLDPTLFFATWGKIVELPSSETEFGIVLESIDTLKKGTEAVRFAEMQTKKSITCAYAPFFSDEVGQLATKSPFQALVTNRTGPVERKTSALSLPQYELRA